MILVLLTLPIILLMSSTSQATSADRDSMMNEIASGAATTAGDATGKRILARGCDPVMAKRAGAMLKPHLSGATLTSCTDDDDFLEKLSSEKWDVIFFAPGACRYSAAKQPIPGGRSATKGFTLSNYKSLVRSQYKDVPICETTEESEIIPRLRAALGLDRPAEDL